MKSSSTAPKWLFNPLSLIQTSRPVLQVTLAGAVLLAAYNWLNLIEFKYDFLIDTFYGHFFPRMYVVPVGFWAILISYVLIEQRIASRVTSLDWPNLIGKGICLHVASLCLLLLHHDMGARLTSVYFHYYVNLVAWLVVIGMGAFGLFRLVQSVEQKTSAAPLDIAFLLFSVLPFTVLGFREAAIGFVLTVAATLLVARNPTRQWLNHVGNLIKQGWNSPLIFAIGVTLLAFAIRAIASHRMAAMGIELLFVNADDPQAYYGQALRLLNGEILPPHYSPGYSGFLALIMLLSGKNLLATLLIQSLFGASVALGVFIAASQIMPGLSARIAAIAAALSQLLIFNSVNFTREMGGSVFGIWAVCCMLALFDKRNQTPLRLTVLLVAYGLLTAAAINIGIMFLGVFLLFSPLILLYKNWTLKKRIVVALSSFMLMYACTSTLNWKLTGKFGLMTRNTRWGVFGPGDYNPYAKQMAEKGINLFGDPIGFVGRVLSDPVETVPLVSLKLWRDIRSYFFESYSGNFDPILLVRPTYFSGNLNFYIYFAGLTGVLLILFQLFGRASFSIKWPLVIVFGSLLVYAAEYIVVYYGMTRYRASIQPLVVMLPAIGIGFWVSWFQGKRFFASKEQ